MLAVLFALLVVGVSFGLAQPPPPPLPSGLQLFAHPGVVNETGVLHFLALGYIADSSGNPQAGVGVSLYQLTYSGGPSPGQQQVASQATNASGFARFDLGTSFPPVNISYVLRVENKALESPLSFSADLLNSTFTDVVGSAGISNPFGSRFVVYGHVLSIDGVPATAADIRLNDSLLGHPDINGYFRFEIPPGDYDLTISFRGGEAHYAVSSPPASGPAYQNGADAVLGGIAFSFIPLFLPIVTIAVCFDAVARERDQGSLEMLLPRRITRLGILFGKFVGNFVAVALPVVLVVLAGIGVVAAVSGKTPTPVFAAGFLAATFFLIAVYVSIMLLLSTLAKSVATAVVMGVTLWLLFSVLFSYLLFLGLISVGVNPSTPAIYNALALLQLFNPNAVYQALVASLSPIAPTGANGLVPAGYVSAALIVASAIVWALGMWMAAAWAFCRRAVPA